MPARPISPPADALDLAADALVRRRFFDHPWRSPPPRPVPTDETLADVLERAVVRWPAFGVRLVGGDEDVPDLVARWAGSEDARTRKAVASRDGPVPLEVVARLAEDPAARVRLSLARHGGDLPAPILDALAADPDPRVAFAAGQRRSDAAWAAAREALRAPPHEVDLDPWEDGPDARAALRAALVERGRTAAVALLDALGAAEDELERLDEALAAGLAAAPHLAREVHAWELESWVDWTAPLPVKVSPEDREAELLWNHHWDGLTPDTPPALLVAALERLRDAAATQVEEVPGADVWWTTWLSDTDVHVCAVSRSGGEPPLRPPVRWVDDLTALVTDGLARLVYEPYDPGFVRPARPRPTKVLRAWRTSLRGLG